MMLGAFPSLQVYPAVLLILTYSVQGISLSNEEKLIRISRKEADGFSEGQSSIPAKDIWKWKYFPDSPANLQVEKPLFADRHNMFAVDPVCDDSKTNLTLDWDGSPNNYTCSEEKYPVDHSVQPIIHGDTIPPGYQAPHYCMHLKIEYPNVLTTFGGHRPQWGRYGEYKFLPRQRWLHNLEHGTVVMLYHPCADPVQVDQLRTLVTSCLFRHIITPYNLLSTERPLALITWGWYLNMNAVDANVVTNFIKEHAFHAPENTGKDGKFDELLIVPAKIVSDAEDSKLCPNFASK